MPYAMVFKNLLYFESQISLMGCCCISLNHYRPHPDIRFRISNIHGKSDAGEKSSQNKLMGRVLD